ncbi:MAG TPA: helix-turn-helix domain-containing protein [Trueperaceae bacterium]|nr:helix-turn-helix domain-containing protein [Trueperaceae bacterium]
MSSPDFLGGAMDPVRQLDTRSALLDALLENKRDGLTLEQLATHLKVSRNAVRQHITALERDGLVTALGMRPGSRRPSRTYGLTDSGAEEFPRRYDLLALSLFEALRDTVGDDVATTVLDALVERVAARWLPGLERLSPGARSAEVVRIMNRLGYHARGVTAGPQVDSSGSSTITAQGAQAGLASGAPVAAIEAVNCVYHRVARETRIVCRFDERLLSRLLGESVSLTACMAEGDGSCVFARLAAGSA